MDPIEVSEVFGKFGVKYETAESFKEALTDLVEAGEDFVAEEVFSEVFPDVFGGVEFGAVRRQRQEFDIGWDF